MNPNYAVMNLKIKYCLRNYLMIRHGACCISQDFASSIYPLDTIHCFFRLSLFIFPLLQCYTKAEGSATLAYDDEKQILLYFDSIGGVCMIDVVSTIHDVLLTSSYITYQMIIHIKHINTRPKFAVQYAI